jgi:hypothetical protein
MSVGIMHISQVTQYEFLILKYFKNLKEVSLIGLGKYVDGRLDSKLERNLLLFFPQMNLISSCVLIFFPSIFIPIKAQSATQQSQIKATSHTM